MKFENTEVWGFEHAIRGMRNPMDSWEKSDSSYIDKRFNDQFHIGLHDMHIMKNLISAGPEHRKFLRQIFISVDITAPLYWWKEFDTYKVGTVADSCSTMHRLKDTPITVDCFEMDDYDCCSGSHLGYLNNNPCVDLDMYWYHTTKYMERLRQLYNETKDKRYWKELIRLLPESWLQKRTVTMNYENTYNIYLQRKNHKLTEWSKHFIQWTDKLPHFKELFIYDKNTES